MFYLISLAASKKVIAAGNELSDVCEIVREHKNGNRVRGFKDARFDAIKFFAGCKAAKSVQVVTMRADDSVELVKFNSNGSFRTVAKLLKPDGRPA